MENKKFGYPYYVKKYNDHLFETKFKDLNYEKAKTYLSKSNKASVAGCTTFVKSGYFCRNFDWFYSNDVSIVVKVSGSENRYSSIGVAGMLPGLTAKNFNNNAILDLIPFFTLDGINEKGVCCAVNVVSKDISSTKKTEPLIKSDLEIPASMLVRFVLDTFDTAKEAVDYIRDYVSITLNKKIQDMGYEVHFLISSGYGDSYVVEFIDNKNVIIPVGDSGSYWDDKNNDYIPYKYKPIITNFYLKDVILNDDGKVTTPETNTKEVNAENYNNITKHGSGLERYNLVANQYNSIDSLETMRECMNSIKYTNAYSTTESPIWITEFAYPYADKGSTTYPNLTAQDTLATYESSGILTKVRNDFATRTRENPNTWQTVHSVVYDINKLQFTLITQEQDIETEKTFHLFPTINDGKLIISNKFVAPSLPKYSHYTNIFLTSHHFVTILQP